MDIGNDIGRFVLGDDHKGSRDQARYLRIRVDIPIDKPLRRDGFVPCLEGERVWINYRYERLLAFCYRCGRLRHDEKACVNHCLGGEDGSVQYGDWLRAGLG